jgi:ABC-2 type transport system ATP-binding protein
MIVMHNSIIQIDQVSKTFRNKVVLKDLTLHIPPGSVLGLLGKNGAGKTTLIKCILGLLKIEWGSIRILGDDPWRLRETSKERLGYVPQVDRIYPWLTVRQLISYTASFYSHWNDALVERLLNEWELSKEDQVGLLSEGQAQKLLIILALAHEPELLIFDEPVASLDPAARRQFIKTIFEVVADRSCTVFFSTHITSDLERVADRVALLKKGKIDFCGELDVLKDEVKRLHIVSRIPIAQRFSWEGILHCESSATEAVVTVRGFTPALKAEIEQKWQAQVHVEDLNLEEIFLELHR